MVVEAVFSAGLISVGLFEGLFGAEVLREVLLGPQPPLSHFQVRVLASDVSWLRLDFFPDLAWIFHRILLLLGFPGGVCDFFLGGREFSSPCPHCLASDLVIKLMD